MEQFDALDKNGNLLGYSLERGTAIPNDVYFGIVTIVCYSKPYNTILVTKRNPNKPSGNLWEITGGGIQSGEAPIEAARRELGEETGIWLSEDDFEFLDKESEWPFICNSYVVKLDQSYQIKLDKKETIDYKWLNVKAFFSFIKKPQFVPQISKRILNHSKEILKIINN